MNEHLIAFLKKNRKIQKVWVNDNFDFVPGPTTGYTEVSRADVLGKEKETTKSNKKKEDGAE